jgi:phosphoribosylformylglycinamidine cyclo-ligase
LGVTLGECLLTPTKIYVKAITSLTEKITIKSVSHITGGGFYENIPRSLPKGISAKIEKSAVQIPPIFNLIQSSGQISEHDMFNTFNMGVGMVVCVDKNDVDVALATLKNCGEDAYVLGELVNSDNGIILE